MLHMDQLAINMLVVAPAVFSAFDVGNCEISTSAFDTCTILIKCVFIPAIDLFDEVRIEAVARLHLAEHHIVDLNICMVFYWLVSAGVAARHSWPQRVA